MNNIFEENLNQINRYNPNISDQLKSITALVQNLSMCETQLKEPNLSINGVPVHSQTGAEKEAKEILEKSEDSANHIHIIFGLGLGYLFKEFCDNAQGMVILYEPNLEVLRITLEMVDFKAELSKKNIFVATDFDMLEKIFNGIYSFKNITKCHFLTYHRQHNHSELEALVKELTRINSIIACNFDFFKRLDYSFILNTLNNLPLKIESKPLDLLTDKFKNVPAVIVSAGPSLAKNIEILKKYQDKVLIFCVGTAYKALEKAGIKPDFLHAIEMHDSSAQIRDFDLSDINFVHEGYTNKEFLQLNYKNKFRTLSCENISNVWLAKILGEDSSKYETKGTVSYNAMYSAHLLGCNPIILIGQDLAYTDGQCYSHDSAFSNLKCIIDEKTNAAKIVPDNYEEYRIASFGKESTVPLDVQNKLLAKRLEELNNSIMPVKGQNGETLITEQGYSLFIEYFKNFAKRFKEEKILINSSPGGAQIDGFNNVPLEDVLTLITEPKPSVDEEINKLEYNPNYENVISNLKNEANRLEEAINLIKNGQIDLKNYKREVLRYKQITEKGSKYLKNCLNTFMRIIEGPKASSELIKSISRDEESNLSWLLKEKDGQFDYQTQLEIIKSLEEYFFNNDKKFNYTRQFIITNIEQLQSRTKILI